MSKQFVKVLVYAAMTLGFLLFILVYHGGMHKTDQIDVSYFQAQRVIFLAGVILLGVGISLRKHLTADALFLSLLGGALLIAFLILFLLFGGMTGAFDATGYAAANAQLVILDVAAIACFVRCAVLSAGLRDAVPAHRWTARLLCAVLAVTIVCLIITGYGTRFVQYEDAALEGYGYSEY
ncbi:MAG: hypothetical protein IKU56_00675 [Clostridia bacterium]|nr:hypothetical protein [Clostridia bacterium]